MDARRRARETLILLTALNFFNYVDRQGVYALFPLIRSEFSLSDQQLGMIATACLLVLAVIAMPGGYIADRVGARLVITIGAFFWSVASAASSTARSFRALLGTRAAVGVGEAAYEPAAHATLCALYPEKKAQALAVFNLGTAFGIAGGMAIAGFLGVHLGWRTTVLILCLPGFALALLAWLRLTHLPSAHDGQATLRELWTVRSLTLALVIFGGTVAAFTAGGLMAWMPMFVVRYHRFDIAQGGLMLGALSIACGAAGALTGGFLGDRLEARRPGGRCRAVAVAFGLVTPIGILGVTAESRLVFTALCGATIFCMSFYAGPIIAVIDDVVPRRFAATAQAAFLLVSHLCGDTWAPTAVGAVADRLGGTDGLRRAVLLPVFACLFASAAFLLASFRHPGDRERARALDAAPVELAA
jgi:MFS family permease